MHTDSGSYAEALKLSEETGQRPDVTLTRRPGTLKYGFGVSADQELTKDIGVFLRLGWNDGKTESFAFTAIDRLASGGVSVNGNAMEAARGYRCDGAHRGRTFRRARVLPRAWRLRFSDRRRRA